MRLAAIVLHAAHRPERRVPYDRLLAQLEDARWGTGVDSVVSVTDEMPIHECGPAAWRAALSSGCDYAVILNDDVTLEPRFGKDLRAALDARRSDIVTPFCSHPAAHIARERGLAWLTSRDGAFGYVAMPSAMFQELLEWSASEPSTRELRDDDVINLWAMRTGRLVWHTVPSLIDQDTAVPSTWGNPHASDLPGHLRASVLGPAPQTWLTNALHVGRVYKGNYWQLLTRLRPGEGRARRYYELAADYGEPAELEVPK